MQVHCLKAFVSLKGRQLNTMPKAKSPNFVWQGNIAGKEEPHKRTVAQEPSGKLERLSTRFANFGGELMLRQKPIWLTLLGVTNLL